MSLLVIGALSIVCSFFSLGLVIDALITTRIVVQFIGQIFALVLLRRRRPDMVRPFRMWWYPMPAALAFAGWIFIFVTSPVVVIAIGLGTLAVGTCCFLGWSMRTGGWPFERRP